ncbi:DUF1127 domain-containing protein [Consotaella salsifontis]|uniref:YjiS-like domain-containing protein n=1 Tax=Consotaella salsifontis TaxID=1365950 RepID=A0A1T4Q0Q2_9HYPH|nr:DUF1127 domain-containing protein [Consotaella salsifontis]SJZ97117.1 protein of unknown function [Consotaella salsifontis]
MTVITKVPTTRVSGGFLANVSVLYAACGAIVRAVINRRQAQRIGELPDHLLTDIGLKRDDVYEALNQDWREDPTYRLALTASQRRRVIRL